MCVAFRRWERKGNEFTHEAFRTKGRAVNTNFSPLKTILDFQQSELQEKIVLF